MSKHETTGTLVPFQYNGEDVRVLDMDGTPWWVAADVARILGYREASDLVRRLDHDDVTTHKVRTSQVGDVRRMSVISEAGLYAAILRANVPAAAPFKRWVTRDVLPSIRKHGGYLTDSKLEEVLSDPDTLIRLATDLKAERAKRVELEAARAADAPKVIFADAVSASHTSILVGELAKLLRGNGVDIGQNRLFAVLRQKGFLIARDGSDKNMPTQRAMELGLFSIKETAITHSDGHVTISKTPKVTGKGQQYFIERFLDGRLGVAA